MRTRPEDAGIAEIAKNARLFVKQRAKKSSAVNQCRITSKSHNKGC
jgi:hypothetical protein